MTSGYRYDQCQEKVYHSAILHKNYKEYFVSVIHGEGSVVTYPDSDVILEVTHSMRTVVMQHSQTNFESVRKAIPQRECLITPVVEFHTLELAGPEELEAIDTGTRQLFHTISPEDTTSHV